MEKDKNTTVEEKAKELIEKFKNATHDGYMDEQDQSAKQCALICVDEIINNKGTEQGNDPIFWHRVKEHISNL